MAFCHYQSNDEANEGNGMMKMAYGLHVNEWAFEWCEHNIQLIQLSMHWALAIADQA